MSTNATGSFEFTSWEEQPYAEFEGGRKLRMTARGFAIRVLLLASLFAPACGTAGADVQEDLRIACPLFEDAFRAILTSAPSGEVDAAFDRLAEVSDDVGDPDLATAVEDVIDDFRHGTDDNEHDIPVAGPDVTPGRLGDDGELSAPQQGPPDLEEVDPSTDGYLYMNLRCLERAA
jgi:hypothetical protein